MCKRVFSVGFGPGLDSPAMSWRSASHAAGSHDWLPKKTGGPGLLRGRIRWIQFAPSLLTVAPQPRTGCIRLVHPHVVVVVDLLLLRIAVEGSDNPISLEKLCQASLPPDQLRHHSIGRHPKVQYAV